MRLPPLHPSGRLFIVLAVLALPLFGAQYSSTSAYELQRRLERDTNQLIDSLRRQGPSSSRSSSSSSAPAPWGFEIRAQREAAARAEQQRMDEAWRRDHPNETRQQYFARIDREEAEQAAEARRVREAKRAYEAAERARIESADWDRVRSSYGGYAAEVRPPMLPTAPDVLAWLLSHDARYHNEWAANQAAMLLIEGIGVPQDLTKAASLFDPNSARARKAGTRHAETRALFAYLQLTFPDAVKAAGLEVNTAAARAELEDSATKSQLAKWYFARVLDRSSAPADQKRALQLITPGAQWARMYFASLVSDGPVGRDQIFKHLGVVSTSLVEKQRVHLPALIRELPMPEFEQFSDLLPYVSEPLRTEAMTLYVEAIAERVIPTTPVQSFNVYAFDSLLGKAGEAGIDGAYGFAALRRFHLLDIEDRRDFKTSWGHLRDRDRTLVALQRWAARNDVLGARARLAIEGLATEAAASQWWTPTKPKELIDYQSAAWDQAHGIFPEDPTKSIFQLRDEAEKATATKRQLALDAFARRDAAAPALSAIPGILASLAVGEQWRNELQLLKKSTTKEVADSPAFAVTHPSFDLAKASTHLTAAFAPDALETVRRHELFEALRLGDAFAPDALRNELIWDLPAPVASSLERLRDARLRRDEAARSPRALLAKAILAGTRNDEGDALLADAAAAGSIVAKRLQLNARIGREMARETDRPPSWDLDPALIAEFDAAVTRETLTPEFMSEWSVVQSLTSVNDANQAGESWFHYLAYWDADRRERLADAAFVKAVQPQIDAVLATLAEWPGINQDDPLRREWAIAATNDRDAALKSLDANDGLAALQQFLNAAGRGDRGALELLSRHVRTGTGGLPRSAELADGISAAALKMTMADAEAGDAFAADFIGECFRNGSNGVTADPLQAHAWLRYAAELGNTSAARTLAQDDAEGLNRTPAEILQWTAVRDACEYNEYLPKPPRRINGARIDLMPIRSQLEAAVTALNGHRTKKPVELTEQQEEAEMIDTDTAEAELKNNPANGLLSLAKLASSGNRYVAHQIARIIARGDYAVQPDPALAQRFHLAALGLLERDAEYGDFNAANRLATYALGMGEKPDIPGVLRWYGYSAELGNTEAAEFLAQLYTDGAPGLAADAQAAARWTAFAEKTLADDFKPREPLR